jgi:hypothetical protein
MSTSAVLTRVVLCWGAREMEVAPTRHVCALTAGRSIIHVNVWHPHTTRGHNRPAGSGADRKCKGVMVCMTKFAAMNTGIL